MSKSFCNPNSFFSTKSTCFDSSLNAPAGFYSFRNRSSGHSELFAPLAFCKSLIIVGYEFISRPIVRVCSGVCPSAIAFAVVSIVINSINLMGLVRSWSHVLIKSLERINPLIANANSSASIPVVFWSFWIATPRLHSPPNVKFRRASKSMGFSILISNSMVFFHKQQLSLTKNKYNK